MHITINIEHFTSLAMLGFDLFWKVHYVQLSWTTFLMFESTSVSVMKTSLEALSMLYIWI